MTPDPTREASQTGPEKAREMYAKNKDSVNAAWSSNAPSQPNSASRVPVEATEAERTLVGQFISGWLTGKVSAEECYQRLAGYRAHCIQQAREGMAGEWSTLMADIQEYFADEKADRTRGRVTHILTLLGQLRHDRDQFKLALAQQTERAERAEGELAEANEIWKTHQKLGVHYYEQYDAERTTRKESEQQLAQTQAELAHEKEQVEMLHGLYEIEERAHRETKATAQSLEKRVSELEVELQLQVRRYDFLTALPCMPEFQSKIDDQAARITSLEAALKAERALVDRLAKLIQTYHRLSPSYTLIPNHYADEALASYTESRGADKPNADGVKPI